MACDTSVTLEMNILVNIVPVGSCGLKSAPRYLSILGLHVHSIRQRKWEINAKVAPTHGEVEVGGSAVFPDPLSLFGRSVCFGVKWVHPCSSRRAVRR